MKSIALLLACFCSASVLAQGRTETLNIEIGRSSAVSLTATEETDTTVNVVVKSGRMDFDLSGWRGVLWYGVQGSGLAITNTSTSYNVFTFDLPTSKIPTNGLYELQVFGVTTNRTEEWARGRMSVRLNPSKGSLPPEWNSYPAFYGPLTNRLAALESNAWKNPAAATNWLWVNTGTAISLTNYNFSSLAVVIPSMLDGLPVRSIRETCFSRGGLGSALISISCPDTLNTFYAAAFKNCTNLVSVTAPGVSYVATYVFNGCTSLTTVSLDAVTSVGANAFDGCSSLASLDLKGCTVFGDYAFYNCYSLQSVNLPALSSLGGNAGQVFKNCIALSDIKLPVITNLGYRTFWSCTNLTSVVFNGNVPARSQPYYSLAVNQVTNYITASVAPWDATFEGMPVVRLPIYGSGAGLTGITAEQIGAYGTNNPSGFVGESITNGLVTAEITNGLVKAAITNGLVGASITNGILSAAQAYATSADTTAKGVSANTATNAIAAASPGTAMIRLTTDRLTSATAPTNIWLGVYSNTPFGTQSVVSVAIGTNLSYAAAIDCTNTPLTEVGGQMINYTLWLCETETGDQTARVEFWRHDIVADTWSAWGALGPTFTVPAGATPSLVSGAVFVPAISTNAYTLGMRIRRVAGIAAATCLLKIGSGPGYDSRLSVALPSYVHNTDPYAHSNMSRSSMIWTAAGTNATYQMSWDITNGTFRVLEILP